MIQFSYGHEALKVRITMALSATTSSSYGAKSVGEPLNRHVSVFRVVGDASYPTGGSALPTGIVPAGQAFYGVVNNISGNVTNTYKWNADTQKLMSFVTATAAQVANAVDLSADTLLFIGVIL